MRFIRFVITVAAIGAVYFAQYIFQHQSLQDFFPQRLLDLFPSLYPITRWLPEDLWRLALWLSAAATVGIGLVAPTWPDGPARRVSAAVGTPQRRARLKQIAMLLALGFAVGLGVFLALGGKEGLWLPVVWGCSVLLYLMAARAAQKSAEDGGEEPIAMPAPRPEQSWRLLLLILLAAGLLFTWPFRTVVPPLNDEIIEMGLRSLAVSQGGEIGFFSNSATTFSGFSLLPYALVIRLTGDGLLAARLVGASAALLTVVATWLLGCELFRRTPMLGAYGEMVEDDGRWPALAASGVVAANVVMFYFSRLPFYLEPVAWGVLGLWLWLRSLRTGNRWGLALSGILIGLATLLYQSGLLFLLLMPFWWLGVRLFQPQWLRSYRQVGEGWRTARHSLVWWGGLAVTLAPLIGAWVHTPALLLGRVQGSWLPDMGRLSAAVNLPLDPVFVTSPLNIGLDLWLAPLLLLAIGCLLLNLDRLVGWLLGSWFGCALVIGGVMAAPEQLWPTLAPILPTLALMIAFSLDRVRTTIIESAGAWAAQAMTYLSIGLILWAAQASWVEYNRFVRTTITPEHYVGFALRRLNPQTQAIGFIQPENQPPIWQTPLVRFLVNDKFADANLTSYSRNTLPATLPKGSVLVWRAAEGDDLLATLLTSYPGGTVRTRRDQWANPIVHFYELP